MFISHELKTDLSPHLLLLQIILDQEYLFSFINQIILFMHLSLILFIDMNLKIIPYIVILVANFLYIYAFSYDSEKDKIQIFLFNFGIMLLVGIFAIIKVNMLLHQWLVVEGESDDKGSKTTKGHMKDKVKELLNLNYLVESLFLPGNERFLLKIYFAYAAFRWVISFIPGIFAGLIIGLYFQYKGIIYEKFRPQFDKIQYEINSLISTIVSKVPRFEHSKKIQ